MSDEGSLAPAAGRHAQMSFYAKSPGALKLRARKVDRLVQKMRAAMPWLEPSDLPACRGWAELEILGAVAFADLFGEGLLNAKGEPRRLLAEYRQLRAT